ncbi:hypothetical protein JYU34_009427 [Plutella xylostella]|uniref:Uncharacterized protein n=1 Tax=Plutella xylostella TaxID=51655 RepID=A0ABQ7QJF7_PLUXY|nr:hypothetical protein JYU34_009427 [Plutella xylostella]
MQAFVQYSEINAPKSMSGNCLGESDSSGAKCNIQIGTLLWRSGEHTCSVNSSLLRHPELKYGRVGAHKKGITDESNRLERNGSDAIHRAI